MQRMYYALLTVCACVALGFPRLAQAVPPPPPSTLNSVSAGSEILYKPGGGDDIAGLQALANKLSAAGGGSIRLAPGRYKITGASSLTLNNVRLFYPGGLTTYDKVIGNATDTFPPFGAYASPLIAQAACVFDITGNEGTPSAQSPFVLINGAACEGFTVNYPHNLYTLTTPFHYPFAFHILHEATVQNIGFVCCDQGVLMEGRRPICRNCYGFFTTAGVRIDRCPDTAVLENFHCVPPGDGAGNLGTYSSANLTAFEFRRVDLGYVVGCMTYAANVGFKFTASNGSAEPNEPWLCLVNCGADVCNVGADLYNAQNGEGIDFTNFHSSTAPGGIACIRSSAPSAWSAGAVTFNGGNLWNANGGACVLQNGGPPLHLNAMRIRSLFQPTATPIISNAGLMVLTNCMFWDPMTSALYAKINPASQTTISNCLFNGLNGLPVFQTNTGATITQGAGTRYVNNANF